MEVAGIDLKCMRSLVLKVSVTEDPDVKQKTREIVKYRKIRLARLRRQTDQEFTRRFDTKGIKKLGQHISLAFSTRFIPEIYMNDQDWFHGYDCLRGFR